MRKWGWGGGGTSFGLFLLPSSPRTRGRKCWIPGMEIVACVCATGFLALPAAFSPELLVEMSPGGRSSNQGSFLFPHSVQTAVINVFKGGGLQSNELYALNESIRYVTGGFQGPLFPCGPELGINPPPPRSLISKFLFFPT